MKIACAQYNFTVGDLDGNAALIIAAAEEARIQGADLLLTPELALSGYPPEDLLLREDFLVAVAQALHKLAAAAHDIVLLVGHPHLQHGKCYNAASVLRDGKIAATYCKQEMHNYSVFDEERYFDKGDQALVFELQKICFGVIICADVWHPDPALLARQKGAQVLLVLNASPYHIRKQAARHQVLRERIRETGISALYVNLVGGQDELVFDGASFAMDDRGTVVSQWPAFEQTIGYIECDNSRFLPSTLTPEPTLEASVYQALCVGVRDYVNKNHFPGALLGLSGGIDSALTLAIAVDALGADRIHSVMMPSEFTADISLADAREMAENLEVSYQEIAIKPIYDRFMQTLADPFNGLPFGLAEENLQARIRGTLLMALSNKFGHIVLTTGNKSEMAVGYATLYGDMAGGFAVLKDIPKTLVYALAAYRNQISAVIPQRIISRPPSAELRPDQTDQDSLPPYDILDGILEQYVDYDKSAAQIIAAGYSAQDVQRVLRLIDHNEYKRRQAPVGVRVSQRGFGKDRRYPITSAYHSGD